MRYSQGKEWVSPFYFLWLIEDSLLFAIIFSWSHYLRRLGSSFWWVCRHYTKCLWWFGLHASFCWGCRIRYWRVRWGGCFCLMTGSRWRIRFGTIYRMSWFWHWLGPITLTVYDNSQQQLPEGWLIVYELILFGDGFDLHGFWFWILLEDNVCEDLFIYITHKRGINHKRVG